MYHTTHSFHCITYQYQDTFLTLPLILFKCSWQKVPYMNLCYFRFCLISLLFYSCIYFFLMFLPFLYGYVHVLLGTSIHAFIASLFAMDQWFCLVNVYTDCVAWQSSELADSPSVLRDAWMSLPGPFTRLPAPPHVTGDVSAPSFIVLLLMRSCHISCSKFLIVIDCAITILKCMSY